MKRDYFRLGVMTWLSSECERKKKDSGNGWIKRESVGKKEEMYKFFNWFSANLIYGFCKVVS